MDCNLVCNNVELVDVEECYGFWSPVFGNCSFGSYYSLESGLMDWNQEGEDILHTGDASKEFFLHPRPVLLLSIDPSCLVVPFCAEFISWSLLSAFLYIDYFFTFGINFIGKKKNQIGQIEHPRLFHDSWQRLVNWVPASALGLHILCLWSVYLP